MAIESGKNPQSDPQDLSQNRNAESSRGDQSNQSTSRGPSASHPHPHDDRSGIRTDIGGSMTEMGNRQHHTNANTGAIRANEVAEDSEGRTGLRTSPGSNRTDAGGRERQENQTGNAANTRTTRGENINERSVTAHNSGDQGRDREEDQNSNKADQQRRKAS